MPRTPAVITTEMALTGELTGLFVLDESLLDGDDVLAGDFNGNVFDDLTGRDMIIGISRGAGVNLVSMQQGEAGVSLSDPDGDFNPENPTSPIADELDVMRPLRIRATHPDVAGTVGLFYGFVRDIEHDPDVNVRQSALSAVDLTEWLGDAGVKPVIASTGPISEGAAIGLVLDAAGCTDPAMRDLDDGGTLADFQADGTESGISLIGGVVQVGLGLFFMRGDGVVRYIGREARFAPQSPVATLDGSLITGVRPRRSVDGVMNRITVTKTGGAPQEAVDEDSRRRYGYRDGSPITSPYFVSDADALSLAQLKVALYARGRAPLREVELINRDDVSIVQQLEREIGDHVTVQESMGGTNAVGEIVGVKHSLPGADIHRTRFLVASEATSLTFFTLDDDTGASVLDGTAVLAY
jgi:hypothetical protein